MIDLHIHTTASDGIFSPTEIIDKALEKKIPAIAITDHDTIDGLKEAIEYAKDKPIDFIPSVELGCSEGDMLHIVGLGIDPENKELKEICANIKKYRENQKKEIVKKLQKLGYNITFREVAQLANNASIGRPHVAQVLMKNHPEKFTEISETIMELLTFGKKAFVMQESFPMKKIIETIKNAGGIPILAHPGYYDNPERIINYFADLGGEGIEVYYPYGEAEKETKRLHKKIAKEKDLMVSGGTDFHGAPHGKAGIADIGSYGLTEEQFEKLKKKLNPNFFKPTESQ